MRLIEGPDSLRHCYYREDFGFLQLWLEGWRTVPVPSHGCSNNIPFTALCLVCPAQLLSQLWAHSALPTHTLYYRSFLLKTAFLCTSSPALVWKTAANPLSCQLNLLLVSSYNLKGIYLHYRYHFPASESNVLSLLKWYLPNPTRLHLKCK